MNFLRRQGIRWRMAMLYLGLFATGLTVFCAGLFSYFQKTQSQAFDTTLYNFVVDLGTSLEMDFVGRLFVVNANAAEAGKLFPFHLGSSIYEIRDRRGRVLVYSRALKEHRLPMSASVLERLPFERAIFQTIRTADLGITSTSPDMRLLSYWVQHSGWKEPLILQVAVPLDLPRQERRDLLLFFFIGGPAFLLAAGGAGVWMSRPALKPVHDMTVKAAAINGVGNLGERIPVPESDDEIRELARTFNGLLERLEGAFASQDRFIANASHQLRTPLTVLKGELELLRRQHIGLDAELNQGLDSVQSEINRLSQLVHDLLLLARLEAGRDTITLNPVRVDEVLLRVVARLQRLGQKKNVKLLTQFQADRPGSEIDAEVLGDEDLLESMLENFIENAIKYSPENAPVELRLLISQMHVVVSVTDSGPGIPAELRAKIFERFTRLQPSHIVPGSGLGLAIAAEIASLHKVQIELNQPASGPGTLVLLTFPRLA